jgi:cation diffusion facilitator CzcD-associated flavoprotein CzcO
MAEPYHYVQQYLGKPRPVRIITIGAGISGIAAVHLFKEKFKDGTVEIVLYGKNEDVGGTWLENRYPGSVTVTNLMSCLTSYSCGCDGPSHGYTYSWKGKVYSSFFPQI